MRLRVEKETECVCERLHMNCIKFTATRTTIDNEYEYEYKQNQMNREFRRMNFLLF